MKVLAFSSHSKNNQFLYNLTIKNHIDYFNKYDISYLGYIDQYSKFADINLIKNLLLNYDLVFSIGSDCLFTNFDINILDFLNLEKDINICEQGLGITLTNGQIIFYRKGCDDLLMYLNTLQKRNPDAGFGTQSIFNYFFEQEYDYCIEHINLIRSGRLQTFLLNQYTYNIRKQLLGDKIDRVMWKQHDFLLHAVGDSNESKYQRIQKIMRQYNF